jgi:DNA-binding GntR family transcriptional regulator
MTNASEFIYATLRRRIMAGFYVPEAQIKEETVAAEISVSRTPVRAALRRLISDGLLVAKPNRGAFVASWTTWDIEEVLELRCLLEPHAAGLAAERATPEQIEELRQLNRALDFYRRSRAANRIVQVQTANNHFHHKLLEAAASPRLRRMAERLVDMPMVIGAFYFYSEADILQSVRHHNEIITAIAAHDKIFATQAMSLHLRASHEIYRRHRNARAQDAAADVSGGKGTNKSNVGEAAATLPARRNYASNEAGTS